jgi:hypothetical protein
VVDEKATEKMSFEFFFFGFSLKLVTQLLLDAHLPPPLYVCENSDHTAHHYIIDIFKVGGFISIQHSAGHRISEISLG